MIREASAWDDRGRILPLRDSPYSDACRFPDFAGATRSVSLAPLEKLLQNLIAVREVRSSHLPSELFADPAWDILLRLALAHAQQQRVSIMRLCSWSSVPDTTVARWLRHLTAKGLLVRHDAPTDARVKFIALSPDGIRLMFNCLTEIETLVSSLPRNMHCASLPALEPEQS